VAHWVGVVKEVAGVALIDGEEFPVFREWADAYVNDATVSSA
jgi:hypothetical protein